MQMGVKNFLPRHRADIRAEIEARHTGVGAHDVATQRLGQTMHAFALVQRRVEDVESVPLRQDQTVERAHRIFVVHSESEIILAKHR